jgi:protein phosphatase
MSAVTDVGKLRTNNEDVFAICPDLANPNWDLDDMPSYIPIGQAGSLLIVADGMGGPDAGEVASEMAVDSVRASFSDEKVRQHDDIDQFLQTLFKEANRAITKSVEEDTATIGMGTTIVVCWILGNQAHIAWCGDSRCYVYNPNTGLKPLTKDHSYVQTLVDKGQITEKEAFYHPESNIITRGLGDLDIPAVPDIMTYPVAPNDLFLLCSDGLCGLCRDREIERVLNKHYQNISVCKQELLKLALDAGGDDNICIALASVIDDNQERPDGMSFIRRIKTLF